MVGELKNITVRIWASVFLGGLASLFILPLLQPFMGLDWVLFPALGILLLVFMGLGWTMNRAGLRLVGRLMEEATVWERSGRQVEAEDVFRKAAGVYDSFLLSPLVRKKRAVELSSRMARFYLARADKDHDSEAFILSYLHAHPEDREVAENWLRQLLSRGRYEKEHHALAFRIGNAHPKNPVIQYYLVRFYLAAGRTDFPALQTYRRVLNIGGKASDHVIGDLADLFIKEGRADEWALRVYLHAYRLRPDRSQLLRGLAACVHWNPETQRSLPMLQKAREILARMDDAALKMLRIGFNPPIPEPTEQKISLKIRMGIALASRMDRLRIALADVINRGMLGLVHLVKESVEFIKSSRKAMRFIKQAAVMGLAVAAVMLLINTAGYLIRTSGRTDKGPPASDIVKDRFTLQVAAYIKPEQAKNYTAVLKKQGVQAYWMETEGEKKKWYQVRVSHFPDKASARAYGESLKQKGLIKDFFVANYEAPKKRF